MLGHYTANCPCADDDLDKFPIAIINIVDVDVGILINVLLRDVATMVELELPYDLFVFQKLWILRAGDSHHWYRKPPFGRTNTDLVA